MSNSLVETGICLELDIDGSQSDGVLSGLRVAVKDLFDIAGVTTSAGNPDWLKTHSIPDSTASSVKVLLENGAKVIGKSLTDELAYSLNGTNVHYGTPVNHRSPNRIPGGSSSGSAVAVSSGVAEIGLGTDTGGSIRVPASYNGLFGLRPTHGRIAMDNMVPLAPSFDTVGWLTQGIDTLLKVAEVYFPEKRSDSASLANHLVVLQPSIAGKSIWHADIDEWINKQTQFKSINRVTLAESFFAQASEAFRVLQGAEIWQSHGDWITNQNPTFAEDIRVRFDWCKTITYTDVEKAKSAQREVVAKLAKILPSSDYVMLLPTTPGAAPLLDSSSAYMNEYRIQLMGLTALAGLSGRPQLSLPLLTDQGSPWGLSLIGARESDVSLIQLASTLLTNPN